MIKYLISLYKYRNKLLKDLNPGVILSYPRSGNHLVRFLVEFATAKPTHGCIGNPGDTPLFQNKYPGQKQPLKHVKGFPDYFKYHYVKSIEHDIKHQLIGEPSKLITIIRNPLECIPRQLYFIGKCKIRDWKEDVLIEQAQSWQAIFNYYKNFNKPKHLVIYENLINIDKKHAEIEKLLSFVDAKEELIQKLMSNLNHYIEVCRKGERNWGGSISEDQEGYHFKNVEKPKELKEKIKEIINCNYYF